VAALKSAQRCLPSNDAQQAVNPTPRGQHLLMIAQISGSPYFVGLTRALQLPLLRITRAPRHDNSGCCARTRKCDVHRKAVVARLRTLDQLAVLEELVPEAPVPLRKRFRSISPRRRTCQHDEAVVQLARSRANADRIQLEDGILSVRLRLCQLPSIDRAKTGQNQDRRPAGSAPAQLHQPNVDSHQECIWDEARQDEATALDSFPSPASPMGLAIPLARRRAEICSQIAALSSLPVKAKPR
jgi:hypothetical protein